MRGEGHSASLNRAVSESVFCLAALVACSCSLASPFIAAGDTALRADIQRLADYGVITGPTTTWPLAWAPILADVNAYDIVDGTPTDILDALARVRDRGIRDTRSGEPFFHSRVSGAEKPKRIRSFEDTPRGRAELGAGFTYTADWFTASINGQVLDVTGDEEEVRVDRSVIAASIGNWSIGINTLERWWGPGWDGSLILSNNARPIPAISIDRTSTDAFETRWLSWIGPWDLSVHFGQFESDRFVPDARLFAMRFAFRPIRSLEIGLSRAAQWCGEGRPCDLETFGDLFFGRDNLGDDGITEETEPGNQLAGFDFRWSGQLFDVPVAAYGQFIGEDEAGGFPSRYLGQVGIEGTGAFRERWSYRWFAEVADPTCQFYESTKRFNCAYNNAIYETGFRYRGRAVGHAAENDARLVSLGIIALDSEETEWAATLRIGELNRGGEPDDRNTLTPTAQDVVSIDIRHARTFRFGEVTAGIGLESIDDTASGQSDDDFRFFLQWRSPH